MLLVKTKIGPSKIHGIGVFAAEFIPKGTIIWKFVPNFDLKFTEDEIKKFPDITQKAIFWYRYISLHSGLSIFCSDDARFYNHSDNPNTMGIDLDDTEGEGGDIALKDIQIGEEITYDYKDPKEGDGDWQSKLSDPLGHGVSKRN